MLNDVVPVSLPIARRRRRSGYRAERTSASSLPGSAPRRSRATRAASSPSLCAELRVDEPMKNGLKQPKLDTSGGVRPSKRAVVTWPPIFGRGGTRRCLAGDALVDTASADWLGSFPLTRGTPKRQCGPHGTQRVGELLEDRDEVDRRAGGDRSVDRRHLLGDVREGQVADRAIAGRVFDDLHRLRSAVQSEGRCCESVTAFGGPSCPMCR